MFYDVFFEPTNRHLVAVGPPLGNLQLDLKIYANGKRIKLSVIKNEKLHMVRGKVSRVEKLNDILIQANGHQWELSVPENNTGTGHQFTLCTIQKDNKEHWIKDWIEHYRKIGVDRVILYDNNSEKLPDVDAIVVPCPYKYSLSKYRSVYGPKVFEIDFLQTSLLTICGYKYRSGHLLNFDIDELLQVKSLEKYQKLELVYFDSYFVETKADGELPQDYSFRHFIYRNAHIRNKAHKYMVKMDAMLHSNGPHYTTLTVPGRIILKLKKILSHHPRSEDVFYHYRGINTGWKWDRSIFNETTEVVKLEDSNP